MTNQSYQPPMAPQAVSYGYKHNEASGFHTRHSTASSNSIDSVQNNQGCFRRLTVWFCGSCCCCCCAGETRASGASRGGATYAGCGFGS
ncbi:hypothetical protein IWW45_000496 [Coemansia sp. RSA 485]|nr:hypothetical protein IWW45_000496 [Coemansia sp. RSA 485]